MDGPIPTRMGDGSLVRMTRAEIEADILAGSEAGAKRAKVAPLGEDEVGAPAGHLRQRRALQRRRHRRRGDPDLGRRRQPGRRLAHHRSAELRADGVHRHGRAVPPRLLVQAHQAGAAVRAGDHAPDAAPAHDPGALRRDARPGALHRARRARAQLVAAVADGPHRRSPCGPGRGGGARRRRHRLRRRGHVRGRRRRHQPRHRRAPPATPTSSPRCGRSSASAPGTRTGASRSAWRASSCSACTASSSTTACASPGCGRPPRCASRRRRAHPSSARRSTSTRARPSPGTSRARARSCKPCTDAAEIPIHLNGGMGVGGVPMHALPPVDAVSRASRACVDLLRLDGL